jgi:hypothetical protein
LERRREMSNTEKKKVNWLRIVRPMAIALVLIILLSYATYAWLKRDWSPEILQSDMRIIAGSGLTFQFEGGDAIDSANINDLLDLETIELKSVSSCSGKSEDFFALEYGLASDVLKKLDPAKHLDAKEIAALKNEEGKYTLLGKKYGYVDLTFTVSADVNNMSDQIVYLGDSSKIAIKYVPEDSTHDPLNAMRVSITVDGVTRVFLPSADGISPVRKDHTGITNERVDGIGYKADGIRPEDAQTVSIYAEIFNSFFKGKDSLFTIAPGEQKKVNVCIWLEGVDEDCLDDVAGSALDLLIEFTADPVQKNSESASAD